MSDKETTNLWREARIHAIKQIRRVCDEALEHDHTWADFCDRVEYRLKVETNLMPPGQSRTEGD